MCERPRSCQRRKLQERSRVPSPSQGEQQETDALREEHENKRNVAEEGSQISEGTVVSGAEGEPEMDLD